MILYRGLYDVYCMLYILYRGSHNESFIPRPNWKLRDDYIESHDESIFFDNWKKKYVAFKDANYKFF